jgi:hypothetical protein
MTLETTMNLGLLVEVELQYFITFNTRLSIVARLQLWPFTAEEIVPDTH